MKEELQVERERESSRGIYLSVAAIRFVIRSPVFHPRKPTVWCGGLMLGDQTIEQELKDLAVLHRKQIILQEIKKMARDKQVIIALPCEGYSMLMNYCISIRKHAHSCFCVESRQR